jgi:D-glycero-alpha-D-manno-heptose-7-phosphate kinase
MAAGKPLKADRWVRATVPNRVDLAGGTLDIYPLYLLVRGSMTVNAAIGVTSRVDIVPAPGKARLVSGNFPQRAQADDTHGFPLEGKLGLIAAALRCFPPVRDVTLSIRNEAPIGSGLGASSALLVATMLAMDALLGRRRRWEDTARDAMEIEAAHLRSLTGRQDHVAALRGGIQGIAFGPGRLDATRIPAASPAGRALAAHGFLAGTGKSHHSSDVNWRMIRGAIEGDRAVLRRFAAIAAAAREAWDAVAAAEIGAVGDAVAREWAVRKTLAPGVSTRLVDAALGSRELRARVAGAKLCGAGGGGMLFGLLRAPEERRSVEETLRRRGFEVRPFVLSAGPSVATVDTR